ncbi:MAG: NAD-dependent epimerase/dehydratase family protein [Gemmatimonadetes bacterium]|nr:NAD-dependent epimerase/dehydratase family protein [Gemmatimonadota bacterium]
MGKTLVTGASGFTGSHLASRLAREGRSVVSFVRPTSDVSALEESGIECRVADIRERRSVEAAFEGISDVYHVAAAYRTEHADRDEFRRVNVDATRHLLDASIAAAVRRFVHCSTVGVQGNIDDPPATEAYRVAPGDHYQETKLEGERLALSYAGRLPLSVVRPVGIHGPGDRRFLKLFRAVDRMRFVMIGSGRTLYHMTYIDDLVDGFLLAGTRPEALGEVFTIGGARYTTLNELVGLIADVLGRPRPRLRIPMAPIHAAAVACEAVFTPLGLNPPLYPRRVEFFRNDRAFDISKARRLLGYQPRVDLEEGLRRTAEWYRRHGWI